MQEFPYGGNQDDDPKRELPDLAKCVQSSRLS
jgi:hypothetical protein